MVRKFQPLTETTFSTSGADPYREGPPIVASAFYDGLNNLNVTLETDQPGIHGGIPLAPLGEDALHVYLEAADLRRFDPGTVRASQIFQPSPSYLGARILRGWIRNWLVAPPWITDADQGTYYLGMASRLVLEESNPPGGFDWELQVPFSWWAVDPAALVWLLSRFYSPGGTTALEYLDRAAIVEFSRGLYSYVRRRRVFTVRTAGETLINHAKRVALEAGAMMRWGGFVTGSTTTQQLGLGVLDWDMLRNLSGIYNADPLEDAGRDMFLTEPIAVRTAEEFVINRLVTRWAGGWAQTFQYRGELGGSAYSVERQFPFEPADLPPADWPVPDNGPPNEITEQNTPSITIRGERAAVRDLPSAIDPETADNVSLTRWTRPRQLLEWAMGPIHWDFDVGDVVHIRHTGLGLDGTEDLLVLGKTIDWQTLHATIQAVEVDLELEAITPTDSLLGSACKVWLRADLGLVTSAGKVSTWVDFSGNGNNATPRVGVRAPNATAAFTLAGYPVPVFSGSPPAGLEIPGTVYDWGTRPLGASSEIGWTMIAVAQITSDFPPAGWVFTSGTTDWGLGLHVPGSLAVWGLLPPNGTGTWGLNAVPLTREWQIITAVYSEGFDGNHVDILRGVEDQGQAPVLDGTLTGFDFQNLGVGFRTTAEDQSFPGVIGELQIYNTKLRPDFIRRLHADIRSRYPGEGL